ncbi:MFS transporter [Paenibacillus tundrae]|uniref:PPP family 3-phenylpropionic acid transporter n=1 Tax=Paenibacillus tundrae TaxID=528187 RepID=A0ABT9WLV2_9BACL|nr:MFS transporter [Paenibacillus tundrae]MDQ0174155.1 PPP family 3-phenylpropionic acid transporter [Paenibacillus tundrae]
MKLSHNARPDQTWLRALMFTIFGSTVLVVSYFQLFFSHLGFSRAEIGYLYGIGPLVSVFSNMFWSMASDRYKTVRKVMIILLAGQFITGMLLANATTFGEVFILVSLFYFFYYPIYPLADTMAITTANKYGRNFTTIRVFGSIGYAFFALTIGYFLGSFGVGWTMWLCIVLAGTTFLISLRLQDQPSGGSTKMDLSGLWAILKRRDVLSFFACVFLLAMGHRMNEAFLTITLKELGAGEGLIGWSLLISSVSEIPIFMLLSKYGSRYKELPLIAFAALMYALRLLLMSISHTPEAVVAIQFMHSVTFGIFYVTAVRYITNLVPDEYRATGMALFTIVWSSLAGLLSGTLGGLLIQHAGRQTFYLTAMAFSLTALLGFGLKLLFSVTRRTG